MSRHYDREGNPVSLEEWTRLFKPEYQQVAQTQIEGQSISTVWLGLDHQFGEGPPLIFETMIFGGPHDEDQWRYTTEAEAKKHHDQLVQALKQGSDALPEPA